MNSLPALTLILPSGQQHDDSNLISEAAPSCGATAADPTTAALAAAPELPTAATSTGPHRRTTAEQSYDVAASTTATAWGPTEAAATIESGKIFNIQPNFLKNTQHTKMFLPAHV